MEPATLDKYAKQVWVPETLLAEATERAEEEGEKITDVVVGYITGYATGDLKTPQLVITFPEGSATAPPHEAIHYRKQRKVATEPVFFRIERRRWEGAMARAKSEGTPLTPIVNRYLRGYASRKIASHKTA